MISGHHDGVTVFVYAIKIEVRRSPVDFQPEVCGFGETTSTTSISFEEQHSLRSHFLNFDFTIIGLKDLWSFSNEWNQLIDFESFESVIVSHNFNPNENE